MTQYIPYTYLIGWSIHNKWYYGSETSSGRKIANPKNLWTIYFTSSKHVKKFRETYGEPDIIQIRKIFKDRKTTLLWEENVLRKMNVVQQDIWLNKCDMSAPYPPKLNALLASKKAIEKIKGKTYEEIYGIEKAKKLKLIRKDQMENMWKDDNIRKKLKTSSRPSEKYSLMMKKRWGSIEGRKSMIKLPVTCPHCGTTGKGSNMTRYHFMNCKKYIMIP